MRQLQNQDMYILSEIADKMDLTFPKMPLLQKNATQADRDGAQKEFGMQLITMLVKRIYRAKNEINQLIANVEEKTLEEVEQMSIKDTVSALTNILRQDGVLDFFK